MKEGTGECRHGILSPFQGSTESHPQFPGLRSRAPSTPRYGLSSLPVAGFTIIEILVASAVMVLLVGMVLALTTHILNTWNQASGTLTRHYEARIVLDLLTQDIESALFRSDGRIWMVSEEAELPAAAGAIGDVTVTEWLRFIGSAPDRPRTRSDGTPIPGDVTAIGYWVDYGNPFGPSERGNLFSINRIVVDGERTFNQFLARETHDNGLAQSVDGFLAAAGAGTGSDRAQHLLAGNIVQFSVRFFMPGEANTTGATGFDITDQREPVVFPGEYSGPAGTVRVVRPLYVDVSVTVLSDPGVDRLKAMNRGDEPEAIDDLLREESETFTRRIFVLSNSI